MMSKNALGDSERRRAESRSWYRRALEHVSHSPIVAVAFGCIVLLLVLAALAPVIGLADPLAHDLQRSRLAPVWWPSVAERSGYLGTDSLGRDVSSRLLYGARTSLVISVVVVGLALLIGVAVGLLAGYHEGLASDIVMRIADAILGLPTLFLAVTVIAALGPSLPNLIIVLAIDRWVPFSRVLRGDVLRLKRVEFVDAARSVGCSTARILLRHILPNALSPIVVLASLALANVILMESALSFLGLGVQPPTPTWGGMLSEARAYLEIAPWMAIFPGAAITVTILAVNIIGDSLRDLLDPRLQV